MKIDAKIYPKSDPKIDVWAPEGLIFEVLGWFLRSRIFDEFSIGKKSAKNLRFWVWHLETLGRRVGRGP